jgi:hypothetical protein
MWFKAYLLLRELGFWLSVLSKKLKKGSEKIDDIFNIFFTLSCQRFGKSKIRF